MPSFRDWFWQLEASGFGPDHFFVARFESGFAGRLLSVVRDLMPMDFVSEGEASNALQSNGVQLFVDQHTFDALQTMQKTGVRSNIYIGSSIEVRDETLSLENTYSRHEVDETKFLLAVVLSADLMVKDWRVFAGGSGYDSIEAARGEDAVSFLEYLKPENQ